MKNAIAKRIKHAAKRPPAPGPKGHQFKGGPRACLAAYVALPAKARARINRAPDPRAALDAAGVRW